MSFKNNIINKLIVVFVLALITSACSNSNVNSADTSAKSQANDYVDKYESFNRKVFAFNNTIDGLLLKPAAKGYKAITPTSIDRDIGNFFANLGDVGNVINNSLQFKFGDAGNDLQRIIINSTLGFAGLVDIASATGLEKHNEDFGQTLAKWGVPSGPYLMLPFLGPSSIRDAAANLSVDQFTDPLQYSEESRVMAITKTLKKRSDLFTQEEVLKDFSEDRYSALRDVWVQNRQFLIRDGKEDEASGSDLIDELESLDDI